jgi:TRAP-type C4-dicarboxylate transport system permease small subunit|tara:strand:+ start:488 stop:1063 length:576 start_codon:yes stop_codon:yes gene_type:complete
MTDSNNNGKGRRAEASPSPLVLEETEVDISDVRWIDLPAFLLFWLLLAVVFLQFFTRYVLNDSLGWTEEIARFLLVMVGFVGAVIAVRKGSHIFLEFFYRFAPVKLGKPLAVTAEAITLSFYSIAAWVSVELALKTKQKMISIDVPKSLVYWVVAASFAAMAIYSLCWLIRKIRQDSAQVIAELEEHAISE